MRSIKDGFKMSTEKCQICNADSTPWIHIGGHICGDCYYAALKLKKFDWVNTKDKLPLYKQKVIFFTTYKDCVLGCYCGLDENNKPYYRSDGDNIYCEEEVTHWMMEPPYPKENNNEVD
jgi:hypothetical protein